MNSPKVISLIKNSSKFASSISYLTGRLRLWILLLKLLAALLQTLLGLNLTQF